MHLYRIAPNPAWEALSTLKCWESGGVFINRSQEAKVTFSTASQSASWSSFLVDRCHLALFFFRKMGIVMFFLFWILKYMWIWHDHVHTSVPCVAVVDAKTHTHTHTCSEATDKTSVSGKEVFPYTIEICVMMLVFPSIQEKANTFCFVGMGSQCSVSNRIIEYAE